MPWSRRTKASDRGFSLIELMLAVSICGFLALALMNLFAYSQEVSKRGNTGSSQNIDRNLAERYFKLHAQNMAPSFNVLTGAEMLDKNGLNFFDWNDEYPVSSRAANDQKREMILASDGRRMAYFLVTSVAKKRPYLIDPAKMYDWATSTESVSGNLTYQGPDYNSYLSTVAPELWKDNTVLMFYVVGSARAAAAQPQDYLSPYVFFGRVQGGGVVTESFGNRARMEHPFDHSALSSLDDFMRRMPSGGGGIPYVFVRAVEMYRYELTEDPQKAGSFRLQFSQWDGSAFANTQTLATDVQKVTFSRSSVADTMVSLTLEIK